LQQQVSQHEPQPQLTLEPQPQLVVAQVLHVLQQVLHVLQQLLQHLRAFRRWHKLGLQQHVSQHPHPPST
jgi:hypothetical protein